MIDDDLTLESPPNGDRRHKKRKPAVRQTPEQKLQSSSLTMRLEGAFEIGYATTWGIPYFQTSPAEDRKHLKAIGDQLGEDGGMALITAFFHAVVPVTKGGDPVVSRSRFSNIRDLSYHTQYLLLQRSRGPKIADRTSDNLHEATKAMGRKS